MRARRCLRGSRKNSRPRHSRKLRRRFRCRSRYDVVIGAKPPGSDSSGAAGWGGIAFEPVDYAMIVGQTEGAGENADMDAVDDALAYFQRIGPAARALADLPSGARPRALERLRAVIQDHHADGRVAMPAAAWIVSAGKR